MKANQESESAIKKTGRPSKFKPEFIDQAKKLAMLGLTDVEMASFFGVAESTFNLWKKEKQAFSEALKGGKTLADAEIAAKLHHRALGYSHPEDDIRVVNGEIVITPTIKHYPPDTTAGIFWLKNRQREKWRDKPEAEDPGDNEATPIKVVVNVVDARADDADA